MLCQASKPLQFKDWQDFVQHIREAEARRVEKATVGIEMSSLANTNNGSSI